jgi:hypothetical protein
LNLHFVTRSAIFLSGWLGRHSIVMRGLVPIACADSTSLDHEEGLARRSRFSQRRGNRWRYARGADLRLVQRVHEGRAYSKVYGRFYRTIGGEPEETADAHHINVNETIDASVFDRWRTLAEGYRPPGLQEWAERKGMDPNTIKASVRADQPSVTAPD